MPKLLRSLVFSVLAILLAGETFAESVESRLLADYAAWREAREAYESRVATGRMDAPERADYEAFLDDLAARVVDGCASLRAAGRQVPQDVACPDGSPLTATATGGAPDEPAVGEANRTDLDAELGASLGRFDDLLLREQDRVRAAKPRTAGQRDGAASSTSGEGATASSGNGQGEGGTGSGTTGTSGTEGAGAGATASAGTRAGQGFPGGLPGGQGGSQSGDSGGEPGQGGLGAPAGSGTAATSSADVPNPSGDDVVARQLREAAESESDPELRARLWEEYRRYRGGLN